MTLKLGVLVSGEGSNLQAVIDAVRDKKLNAEIVLVASDKSEIPALKKAEKAGIPYKTLNPAEFSDRENYDQTLAHEFLKHQVQLVVLAGFMRILSAKFLACFPDAVINIHPSLLPDDPEKEEITLPDGTISRIFRGKDAVKLALEAGVSWTGCTVHLVTEKVDQGPVLAKKAVPILPHDTVLSLHSRIKEEEHHLLPLGIQEWVKKMLKVC